MHLELTTNIKLRTSEYDEIENRKYRIKKCSAEYLNYRQEDIK